MFNLPNILTLSRIATIPVLVGLFYLDGEAPRWVALGVFALAGFTDFLDGYLARSLGAYSALGRFLDPVADKLLVGAVIFMLVAFDRVTGLAILPALVILIREILVSGLREFLAGIQVSVPVSKLAKWKTTIQMLAIGFLIVGTAAPAWIPASVIGNVGLWIAAALTLYTGYDYLRSGVTHMMREEGPVPGKGGPGKKGRAGKRGAGGKKAAKNHKNSGAASGKNRRARAA